MDEEVLAVFGLDGVGRVGRSGSRRRRRRRGQRRVGLRPVRGGTALPPRRCGASGAPGRGQRMPRGSIRGMVRTSRGQCGSGRTDRARWLGPCGPPCAAARSSCPVSGHRGVLLGPVRRWPARSLSGSSPGRHTNIASRARSPRGHQGRLARSRLAMSPNTPRSTPRTSSTSPHR